MASLFSCSFCTKGPFKSKEGLRTHITKKHPSEKQTLEKKPFPCPTCTESYSGKTGLSRHMKDHKKAELMEQKMKEERLLALEKEISKKNEEITIICEFSTPQKLIENQTSNDQKEEGLEIITKERELHLQLQMNTELMKNLTEEISGLKQMLSQFMERDTAALVSTPSAPVPVPQPIVQNVQINNNITFLNINSTRVREETTQSMFVNGILVYRDDILWRSVLYTHFSEFYPEMQSVGFYQKNGKYTAKRFDLGETPVSVDAKQLAEELLKLRKDDIDFWLNKYFPKFDPRSCDDSEEAYEINQVLSHLSDLKNSYIWRKELEQVLKAATTETKRVKGDEL